MALKLHLLQLFRRKIKRHLVSSWNGTQSCHVILDVPLINKIHGFRDTVQRALTKYVYFNLAAVRIIIIP